jgi:hypothetical protein
MMRKVLLVFLFLTLFVNQGNAIADPPIPDTPDKMSPRFAERIDFPGNCFGRSDLPHISTHVPGTVNVQAYTYCPKKGVSVKSTLTRTYAGASTIITKSNKGIGRTSVNLAFKCVWKAGKPLVEYAVDSLHKLSNGASGETHWKRKLKC